MFAYFEWLIPAFPFLGALINGFLGPRLSRRAQGVIACGAAIGSLLSALPLLVGTVMAPGTVGHPIPVTWIRVWSGNELLEGLLALRVDALSTVVVLTAIVTALFIHSRAAQELENDDYRHTTLALLNATLAASTILVLADDLLLLFASWSLVGWCTYGLIRDDARAGSAPGKGSILSLLGDLCLLLAAGTIGRLSGSLSMHDVLMPQVDQTFGGLLPADQDAVAALLIAAAAIRAAQFPLHVWVPEQRDSLAGATTYALTSVLPGVYLLTRAYPLIGQAPFAPPLLSWWGAAAGLLTSLVALLGDHTTARRYIAFSQTGLLFLALGIGAQPVAISFLPAYALTQILVHSTAAASRRGTASSASQATETRQWTDSFGLAALASLPLLPGFAFNAQLLAALFHADKWLWGTALSAALLLPASATRAALAARGGSTTHAGTGATAGAPPGSGRTWLSATLALVIVGLGLANLSVPPLQARLFEPIVGYTWEQPAWWWFGVAAAVPALGIALGYALHLRPATTRLSALRWIAEGYRIGDLYEAAVTRPILNVGTLIAFVENAIARGTHSTLSRLFTGQRTTEQEREGTTSPTLALFILGAATIIGYLFFKRG